MDKNKILTWEEYRNLKYRSPWFFTLKKDDKILYFVGVDHINKPEHPQNNFIKEKWNEWVKLTEKLPRIVFQEGGLRELEKSAENAIIKNGEAGLVTYLANKDGVAIISPELEIQNELDALSEKLDKDAIAYYYFARIVDQWLRMQNPSPLESYAANFFKRSNQYKGWESYKFTLENFIKLHKKFLNKDFDEQDRMTFNNAVNPAIQGNIINETARSLQKLRDENILEQINKNWSGGKSLFIVYGASHAMRLEPAIKF